MRMKTIVLLNVVIIIGIVSITMTLNSTLKGGEHNEMITKWNYKSIVADTRTATVRGKLNNLGSEGWELVSVVKLEYGESCFFLKKPLHPHDKN